MWCPPDLRRFTLRVGEGEGAFELWDAERCRARLVAIDAAHTWACGLDAEGRWHGLEREWLVRGGAWRLVYRARFRHGLQHGWQEQWDAQGRVLVRTHFVHGTGTDVWHGGAKGWEVRALRDGLRHGVERHFCDRRHVDHEQHFAEGLEHGIERRWTSRGTLVRGYPRFFLRGERVTKPAYLRAAASDPSLPAPRDRDDHPTRRFLAIEG